MVQGWWIFYVLILLWVMKSEGACTCVLFFLTKANAHSSVMSLNTFNEFAFTWVIFCIILYMLIISCLMIFLMIICFHTQQEQSTIQTVAELLMSYETG